MGIGPGTLMPTGARFSASRIKRRCITRGVLEQKLDDIHNNASWCTRVSCALKRLWLLQMHYINYILSAEPGIWERYYVLNEETGWLLIIMNTFNSRLVWGKHRPGANGWKKSMMIVVAIMVLSMVITAMVPRSTTCEYCYRQCECK